MRGGTQCYVAALLLLLVLFASQECHSQGARRKGEPARIVIFPKSIEVISRMKKPPSLPRVLSNMTAAAATNLTTNSTDANVKSFPCRSRGTRPLHIGWYRNGVLIRTANVSSLPLVLRGNDSDDATYVCRTWNAYGNDSRVVRIIIHYIYPYRPRHWRLSYSYWFILTLILLMLVPSLCYLSRSRKVRYVWRRHRTHSASQSGGSTSGSIPPPLYDNLQSNEYPQSPPSTRATTRAGTVATGSTAQSGGGGGGLRLLTRSSVSTIASGDDMDNIPLAAAVDSTL
ncbi:uncharacterized protein LOC135826322 [Sycon ciliatum]|uniref:uncharacterized protein LOC135826322 n=1 Tax=Sycon ciliatum TaxID=27933 RepID=UPI0031F61415